MSTLPPDLQRFVEAQRPVYDHVVDELRAGEKRTHWMWFIFPQLTGLGHSAMARQYALSGLIAARAYLAHPLLGTRLRECTRLVLAVRGRSIEEIFGYPDHLKFHSSMTLFAQADPAEPLFAQALRHFFDSRADLATLRGLGC